MAECHPVGFQWVMEAKRRGAKIIHVDPRFTRTSAVADIHVPIRAGSDIVFLGGIIRYILENRRYFRDYLVHYTNAPAIISEDFRDTEDLDGLFSGWEPEKNQYDPASWSYEGMEVTPAAGAREQLTGEPHSERASSSAGTRAGLQPTLVSIPVSPRTQSSEAKRCRPLLQGRSRTANSDCPKGGRTRSSARDISGTTTLSKKAICRGDCSCRRKICELAHQAKKPALFR